MGHEFDSMNIVRVNSEGLHLLSRGQIPELRCPIWNSPVLPSFPRQQTFRPREEHVVGGGHTRYALRMAVQSVGPGDDPRLQVAFYLDYSTLFSERGGLRGVVFNTRLCTQNLY